MSCFITPSHINFLSGYTASFLRDLKLEDSFLAACLSDQVPGDDTPPKDDDSDVPLSDLPGGKVPAETSTLDEKIKELGKEQKSVVLEPLEKTEMQVKQVFIKDVPLRYHPKGYSDIAICQLTAVAGTILKTHAIKPNLSNTNQVEIAFDTDPALYKGRNRVKQSWNDGYRWLAHQIMAGLDDVLVKENKQVTDDFQWDDAVEVEAHSIDPYVLGLREGPTADGSSLYETECVTLENLDGNVVPCWVITAFFLVRPKRDSQVRAEGNLTIDLPFTPPPPPPPPSLFDDDVSVGGGSDLGKPDKPTSGKKMRGSHASRMASRAAQFGMFALIGVCSFVVGQQMPGATTPTP